MVVVTPRLVLIDARLTRVVARAAAAVPVVLLAAAEGDAEAVVAGLGVGGAVGEVVGVGGRGRRGGEADEGVVAAEGGRHLAVGGRHRGELGVQVLRRQKID